MSLRILPPFAALHLNPNSKGDRTKMAIIAATIDCIADLGYERTNYETIGQKCGLERPHVLYHYPDKEHLFANAVRYVYAVGAAMVEDRMKKSEWNEDLRNYISGTFTWMSSDKRFPAVLCLAFYLSSIDKHYRNMMTEVRTSGEKRVLSILLKHPRVNDKTLAKNLAQSIHGLIFNECVKILTCNPTQMKTQNARSLQKRLFTLVNAMVRDDG